MDFQQSGIILIVVIWILGFLSYIVTMKFTGKKLGQWQASREYKSKYESFDHWRQVKIKEYRKDYYASFLVAIIITVMSISFVIWAYFRMVDADKNPGFLFIIFPITIAFGWMVPAYFKGTMNKLIQREDLNSFRKVYKDEIHGYNDWLGWSLGKKVILGHMGMWKSLYPREAVRYFLVAAISFSTILAVFLALNGIELEYPSNVIFFELSIISINCWIFYFWAKHKKYR